MYINDTACEGWTEDSSRSELFGGMFLWIRKATSVYVRGGEFNDEASHYRITLLYGVTILQKQNKTKKKPLAVGLNINTRQIMEKLRSSVGSRIVYLQIIVFYALISQRTHIKQTKIHSFPA